MEVWRIHDVITTPSSKASLRNVSQNEKGADVYSKILRLYRERRLGQKIAAGKPEGAREKPVSGGTPRVIEHQLMFE